MYVVCACMCVHVLIIVRCVYVCVCMHVMVCIVCVLCVVCDNLFLTVYHWNTMTFYMILLSPKPSRNPDMYRYSKIF